MNVLQNALALVREHRRAYLILNLAYYGLVAAAMVYVAFNPALQQTLIESAASSFSEGPLAMVGGAYGEGQVLLSIALTFVINLLLGSFLVITLPSLVIPFSGMLIGILRAVLWGLLLSPANPTLGKAMIPHSLTLILEGQGYIAALLAVYIQGRAFLWPRSVGAAGAKQGYWIGLKRTVSTYLLVIIWLAAAAIYEALEVIFIVPRLVGGQ